MDRYETSMAPLFAKLLAHRATELWRVIEAESCVPPGTGEGSVSLADAQLASQELDRFMAARRRMREGTYGRCLDCGAAIGLARLSAFPAAAHCAACQSMEEREDERAGETRH